MGDGGAPGKSWRSTSLTIPGGAPISLTLRPAVGDAFDSARVRAHARNRSDWAEGVILAATEGIFEGDVHERLRAASDDLDIPVRTLVRLWLMVAADEKTARSMAQARASQVDREHEK
jgi:hypothetical protein